MQGSDGVKHYRLHRRAESSKAFINKYSGLLYQKSNLKCLKMSSHTTHAIFHAARSIWQTKQNLRGNHDFGIFVGSWQEPVTNRQCALIVGTRTQQRMLFVEDSGFLHGEPFNIFRILRVTSAEFKNKRKLTNVITTITSYSSTKTSPAAIRCNAITFSSLAIDRRTTNERGEKKMASCVFAIPYNIRRTSDLKYFPTTSRHVVPEQFHQSGDSSGLKDGEQTLTVMRDIVECSGGAACGLRVLGSLCSSHQRRHHLGGAHHGVASSFLFGQLVNHHSSMSHYHLEKGHCFNTFLPTAFIF